MSNKIYFEDHLFTHTATPGYISTGKHFCFLFKGAFFNKDCLDLMFFSLLKALRKTGSINRVTPGWINLAPPWFACTIFYIPDGVQEGSGDLFVCLVLPKRYNINRSFFEEILSSKESKALLIPATIYMAAFKNTFLLGRFIDSHCLNIDTSSSALYREFNFVRYLNFFDVK